MADIIQLLPDHVANQIAAGEVVQRPASVVKELLENAIDAGATHVKLIVKESGKTLIQVVDDGFGMSPTDARLSFERHATSKIKSAQDLFQLNTKGFRGEALASIAAIAHVEMQTRQMSEELGTAIKIEGSKIISQDVVATPKGTSIAVKNLFFNIPARRNFLKSNQVELRHITDEFHRVALAHPQVSFHFYNNGSELFNLGAATYRKRIVNIFGNRSNEKLVPVEEETQVVKISGFICKPEFAKKSRGEQFFFVNNRFIKSHYLYHAVVNAFEGIIKPDTHPGYFLYLEVDPSSIDINIHPTKTEIKFDDEQTLYAIIRSTIKHSLGQFNIAPVLDFDKDQNLETPYAYKNISAPQPKVAVDARFNPFKSAGQQGTASGFKKKSVIGWEEMYVGLSSSANNGDDFSSTSFESETITSSIFEGIKEAEETTVTTLQLRRKYIVSTIKSGLLVIHQNRAHQRVLYEKFLRTITAKETTSQQLLFPLALSFSKADMTIIREISEHLRCLGFVFEDAAQEQLSITGVPVLIPENEVGIVLDQLISDYNQEVPDDSFSQSDVLAKALCKSLAVKSGDILDSISQVCHSSMIFLGVRSPGLVRLINQPIKLSLKQKLTKNLFKWAE